MKWNDIPAYESTEAEVKAHEFDLQWKENGGRDYREDEHGQDLENE